MEKSPKRQVDVLALLLVLAALWVSVLRLQATQWVAHLGRVETLVLLGFLLGSMLGKSSFRRSVVFALALVYSLFFAAWQMGSIMGEPGTWLGRLSALAAQLGDSWSRFVHNQPVTDPLLFLAAMAVLYWALSLGAGYGLVRQRRPWISLLLAGMALLIIDHYDPLAAHRGRYTGIFVLCVLLLTGRLYYLQLRQKWEAQDVGVDIDTGPSLIRGVFVGALLLVVLAWNLPAIFETLTPGSEAQQRLSHSWLSFRDRLSNAFAGLKSPLDEEYYRGYLELGSGAATGDEVLFTVSVPSANVRYYWRGASYDRYEAGQWRNSEETAVAVPPSAWPLRYPYPISHGREKVELTLHMESRAAHIVYAPALPVYLDHSVSLVGENIGEDGAIDPITLLAQPVLSPGEKVQVQALVSRPTVEQLQAAGSEYPDWVIERYLQLPEGFSGHIAELAQEITAGQHSTYDQVMAITDYLRQNISYQAKIPVPPAGHDPIEWFLFESKSGFCNYYASAEVLMLRAVGIPARVVTGYAAGLYDAGKRIYQVRAMDSHAWPEVFFPGLGWVAFEPTVSQPPTSFPHEVAAGLGNTPLSDGVGAEGEATGENLSQNRLENVEDVTLGLEGPVNRLGLVLGIALLLLGLWVGAGIWLWRRLERRTHRRVPVLLEGYLTQRGWPVPKGVSFWAHWAQLSPIERLFAGVPWMLAVLGARRDTGQTPAEQIALIAQRAPQSAEDGKILLREYQLAVFSPYPYQWRQAVGAYWRLWRRVIVARLEQQRQSLLRWPGWSGYRG